MPPHEEAAKRSGVASIAWLGALRLPILSIPEQNPPQLRLPNPSRTRTLLPHLFAELQERDNCGIRVDDRTISLKCGEFIHHV